MTTRANVITELLNDKFFTVEKIEDIANYTENAILILNGLKRAGEQILITRDEISDLRKNLMYAIDAQDRDGTDAAWAKLKTAMETVYASKFLAAAIAFGRVVKAIDSAEDNVELNVAKYIEAANDDVATEVDAIASVVAPKKAKKN